MHTPMDTLSLTKKAKTYNGEKTVSLTSGAGKTGQPLVKDIVFSPLYILASFVKDKVSIGAWIYLWDFYFVPLIYSFAFAPVPYCLDDCNFVVETEVRQVDSSSFSRLLWLFKVFCISIQIVKLFVLAL